MCNVDESAEGLNEFSLMLVAPVARLTTEVVVTVATPSNKLSRVLFGSGDVVT